MSNNFFQIIFEKLNACATQELIVWPAGEGKPLATKASTGKDMQQGIAAMRNLLRERGVRKGQNVVLALPIGYDLICSLLAVMAAGAVPVLPPAKISKPALLRLLYKSNINYILAEQKPPLLTSIILKAIGIKGIPASAPITRQAGVVLLPEPVAPDQAALVSHSSGSTGKPKAIHRSHQVLQAQHRVLKEVFPPEKGQRDFPLFPNVLLHNLATGTCSVLPDIPWTNTSAFEPARIVQQMEQHRVQTLTGNVYYFSKLLAYLRPLNRQIHGVKKIGIGGSPVPEKLVHALKETFANATIYVIYGSSEAEPIAVREIGAMQEPAYKGYLVGKPLAALEFKLDLIGEVSFIDGTSFPVGEIMVRGTHVATENNSWLHTGDFGYTDAENRLFLTGRQGNEQLHRGVQHYQVEHVLLQIDGIAQAAALASDAGFDIYVAGSASTAAILAELQQQFPKVPFKKIYRKDRLPVDARHHAKTLYSLLK